MWKALTLATLISLIGAPLNNEPDRVVVMMFNSHTGQVDEIIILPQGTPFFCPAEDLCYESFYSTLKDRSLDRIEKDLQALPPPEVEPTVEPPLPELAPKIDG